MTNRNPVKSMFITFPKSNLSRKDFSSIFMPKKPTYMKCVEEHHKDGTPHLHLIIQFSDKFSKGHIVKFLKEKLPDDYKRIDVQTLRSIKHSEVYLNKEDTTPYILGEMLDQRRPPSASQNFLKSIGEYRSLSEVLEEHGNQLKRRQELIQQYIMYVKEYDCVFPTWEQKNRWKKFVDEEYSNLENDITYFNDLFNN